MSASTDLFPMDSTGGHGGVISVQAPVGRKEWRVVAEGSGRDSSNEHARVNGSARMRPNSGASRQSSRNGRVFHSGSSGSSSDSDHQGGDLGGSHLMGTPVSHRELTPQSIGQAEDAILYEEIQTVQQQTEHLDPAINGLSLSSGGLSSPENPEESLQQRLHEVMRQREHLQQMEVELRAEFIARSEILRLKSGFDEQTKQHAGFVTNLQEQLQERDHRIHDLEQRLEETEQQLHAKCMEAKEAVWAKDGLLREQSNELITLRRDHENAVAEQKAVVAQFEAERAQFLAQLQDMKEQVQEKERQMQEIDEQRRNTQDVLILKEEQLKEVQVWIQRAQELDAFHTTANNSLHAELRDRTDQMNQLWMNYQRQLADVERFHTQTIQGLQLEVAEVREQNRLLRGGGSVESSETNGQPSSHLDSKEVGGFNGSETLSTNSTKISIVGMPSNNHFKSSALANGTADNALLETSKVEHATGLPVTPTPVLGVRPVLPTGSMVLHQFGAQRPNVAPTIQPAPLQILQSPLNQFQAVPAVISTHHHLPAAQQPQRHAQRQQQHHISHPPNIKPESLQQPRINEHHQQQQLERSQNGPDHAGLQRRQVAYISQTPNSTTTKRPNIQQSIHQLHQAGGQMLQYQHPGQFREQSGTSLQVQEPGQDDRPPHASPAHTSHLQEEEQQQEVASNQLNERNGQLDQALTDQGGRLDQQNEPQSFSEQLNQHQQSIIQIFQSEKDSKSKPLDNQVNSSSGEQASGLCRSFAPHVTTNQDSDGHMEHQYHKSRQVSDNQELRNSSLQQIQQATAVDGSSKVTEPVLLDERSLLAYLVRAIPVESSARIRISTTLPNRLGKMLAPLHWHDYKKQYGRLDEFIGSHPELFVIEGDFVHLREGAHAIVSVTTAVAKVAAVAAASPVGSGWLPTVAVTPVAQSQAQRVRNSKGIIVSQQDSKHGSYVVQNFMQSTNAQPSSLFSQQQHNGSPRPNPGPMVRSTVGDKNTNQNQMANSNSGSKFDGQQVLTLLGPRPDFVSSNGANPGKLEKESANDYRVSDVINGRNNVYYGNRQIGRSTALGSVHFGKQDFISRPQTQESRMSELASTAAH